MYLDTATEEDKKMAESWKDDADGILIFVRRYYYLLFLTHVRQLACYRPDYSLLLLRR